MSWRPEKAIEIANYADKEGAPAAQKRFNLSHESIRRARRQVKKDREGPHESPPMEPSVDRILRSYAHSYRIQKVIEALPGGGKPNVLLAGRVHKMGYFFERNIHAVSGGCLQAQTPWMRGKRLSAHTGFWIIEMDINDGIVRFAPTFYPYY